MDDLPLDREHERLGPYRLLQRLGEGGMGVVHLALDDTGRAVAVKVLRDHIAHDPQARVRLAREVQTLSRVRHPAVAPIIGADVDGPRPYLVTRYVPGPALDTWVERHGPMRGAELVRLARGLSEALQAIHEVGVVHRDLKPGNVLLLDGDPVVIDFGIAHIADDIRLTVTGLVMGTPGYLSPEVVAGGEVTEATDWWGWAATLAFAAQGSAPFGKGPMEAVVHRVRTGDCDLSGVDPRLAPLLAAALHPDAQQRPERPVIISALERYALGGDTTQSLRTVPETPGQAAQAVTEAVPIGPATAATLPVGATHPAPTGAESTQVLPGGAAARHLAGEPAQTLPETPGITQHQPVTTTRQMPVQPEGPARPDYVGFHAPALLPAAHPSGPPVPVAPAGSEPAGQPHSDPSTVSAMPPPPVAAMQPQGWPAPSVPAPEPAATVSRFAPPPVPTHRPDASGASVWAPPGTADAPTHGSGPPGRDPRIGRSSRTGTLLAGLALVATAAAVAPVLAAIGWLAWATVARVADRTLTGLTLKRIERGARSSDVPLTVLAVPVHLLTSILSTLVSAVLPVIVGAATAVTAAYLESALGQQTMAVDRPLPMAVGAVVGVGLSWWGVGGTSLRRGSRSLVRGLSPGRGGAAVASTLLLLGAAYLALRTQASGSQVVWWPLQGSPRRWVGW